MEKCYSVSEILCGTNIMLSDCEDRVCGINDAMDDLYYSLYDTHYANVAQGFEGDGDRTIQLEHTPLGIKGFFGYGKGCGNKKCFIPVDKCIDCDCPQLYSIVMDQSVDGSKMGSYSLHRTEDGVYNLNFTIPNGVESGYVVYSRGHDPIEFYDDKICMDPRFKHGLKLLLRRGVAFNDHEYNQYQLLSSEYDKWVNKITKIGQQPLIRVVGTNVR